MCIRDSFTDSNAFIETFLVSVVEELMGSLVYVICGSAPLYGVVIVFSHLGKIGSGEQRGMCHSRRVSRRHKHLFP